MYLNMKHFTFKLLSKTNQLYKINVGHNMIKHATVVAMQILHAT